MVEATALKNGATFAIKNVPYKVIKYSLSTYVESIFNSLIVLISVILHGISFVHAKNRVITINNLIIYYNIRNFTVIYKFFIVFYRNLL